MTKTDIELKFEEYKKEYPQLKSTRLIFNMAYIPYYLSKDRVGGAYIPDYDLIQINMDWSKKEFILAHEVKHVLQFARLAKHKKRIIDKYKPYSFIYNALENDANRFAEKETGIKFNDYMSENSKRIALKPKTIQPEDLWCYFKPEKFYDSFYKSFEIFREFENSGCKFDRPIVRWDYS